MTRTLITGGTGFIGSRLALRSVDAGEEVRVFGITRTPAEAENADTLRAVGVEVIEGSVTDRDAVWSACRDVDVIYHLAAAQHEANVPDSHFRDVNVQGTRNLLDAALAEGVERFVHGSTIGVYGPAPSGPVTDSTPLEPENIYGVTKLAGEREVEARRGDLRVAILRISETYGPGDRRLLKLYNGIAKGRFVRIGSGRNLHHPVYIDDLVEALRTAAECPERVDGPVVVAGPRAVTSDEMISAVAAAVGKPPPRLRIPLWPLMAMAVVMESTLRPLGIQPPLHRRRMNFFIKSFRFDPALAEERLGHRPRVDFPDGAARTADWYRAEGLLATAEG